MTAAEPRRVEYEDLECVAGPLCGRFFRIRKNARGLALNATMMARFKREAKIAGLDYRHGIYLREVWRNGKAVLLWTELPIPRAFGRAR